MLLTKIFESDEIMESGEAGLIKKKSDLIKKKNDFIDRKLLTGYIILEITFKRFFLYNRWHFAYIILYVNDN